MKTVSFPKSPTVLYKNVFKNMPAGQMIINYDTTLHDANKYIFNIFKIPVTDVKGLMFGNVFPCANLGSDELICGSGEKCKFCGIRGSLNAILYESKEISDAILEHDFIIEGKKRKKWFQVSGKRMDSHTDIFALLSFMDITATKEEAEKLHRLLEIDQITGAYNKPSITSILNNLLKKNSLSFYLCMVDLDDFKVINDRYGHLIGDKVLRIFGEISNRFISDTDYFGRFGGEEFVFIFFDVTEKQAAALIKAILAELNQRLKAEEGFTVQLSGGLCKFQMGRLSSQTSDTLISVVDELLYIAKEDGKNQLRSFRNKFYF